MRRLGALLMIVGANLIVGSIAMGFYLANLACAMITSGCTSGPIELFIGLMASAEGLIFWAVIVAGVLVFWWGKRMRARA